MANKIDRTGEINYNNFGTKMIIIQYNNYDDIIVEFQDEYKANIHTQYYHFKRGNVINPYDKKIYNKGFIGIGKYSYKNHKYIYNAWKHMLNRCYSDKKSAKNSTYVNCEVCEEWLNFQNFAKWYEENYYKIEGEKMCLDKDILYKGNKLYSPSTCIIVSNRINVLFVKSDKSRGEYPIGCSYDKERDKIEVHCQRIFPYKRKFLGRFPLDRPFQAFTCYKQFKEKYIKEVAEEYKELIPKKLYDAMYKYEVEIND